MFKHFIARRAIRPYRVRQVLRLAKRQQEQKNHPIHKPYNERSQRIHAQVRKHQ